MTFSDTHILCFLLAPFQSSLLVGSTRYFVSVEDRVGLDYFDNPSGYMLNSNMSYDQGSYSDGLRSPVDDGVSLNTLTTEELGAIVRNDRYRSLINELLPLYDDDGSREPGMEALTSHRLQSDTRHTGHDTVGDNAGGFPGGPSVEETPIRRLPRRKRRLKISRKGRAVSARKMSTGGADTSPVAMEELNPPLARFVEGLTTPLDKRILKEQRALLVERGVEELTTSPQGTGVLITPLTEDTGKRTTPPVEELTTHLIDKKRM